MRHPGCIIGHYWTPAENVVLLQKKCTLWLLLVIWHPNFGVASDGRNANFCCGVATFQQVLEAAKTSEGGPPQPSSGARITGCLAAGGPPGWIMSCDQREAQTASAVADRKWIWETITSNARLIFPIFVVLMCLGRWGMGGSTVEVGVQPSSWVDRWFTVASSKGLVRFNTWG